MTSTATTSLDPGGDPRASYASGTLTKGLALLEAVIADDGRSTLSIIAERLGIPPQTAHRLALTLEGEGFLTRLRKGVYAAGGRLIVLAEYGKSFRPAMAALRRPLMRLATAFGAYAHAGIYEDGMVTYMVKEPGGAAELFTAEKMQLEAYCSAIGKVLLAALPDQELTDYLADGPLVALTPNTVVDASMLRRELEEIRIEGVAYDRLEIREDLFCIAVPVSMGGAGPHAAISLSFLGRVPDRETQRAAIRRLRSAAIQAQPHLPAPA